MDSPFNQGFGRGQSPTSPQTPGGASAYQVNVNRTKTRKWVEAKIQSYDGDDWGADEYDDEDDEPEPTPQVPPAKHNAPLPSAHPEQHAAPAPPTVSSVTGSLPARQTLHTPAAGPSPQQPRPAGVTSPVASDPSSMGSPVDRDRVVSPQSTIAGISVASNTQPLGAAAEETPVGKRSDTTHPPSEADKQPPNKPAIEERLTEVEASDRHETSAKVGESEAKNNRGAGFDESDRRRFSVSPTLPAVAQKDSDVSSLASPTCFAQYDAELAKPQTAAAAVSPPVTDEAPVVLTESVPAPANEQLGDVAKTSTGDKSPIADMDRPSCTDSATHDPSFTGVNESAARPTAPTATDSTEDPGVSPVSEPGVGPHSTIGSSVSEPPELRPDGGLSAIPPLRTPSPRGPAEKQVELARPLSSEAVKSLTVETTQPHVEFDNTPLLRQSTLSTVNESPMKDNDALSEEILRSLSPTRSGPSDAVLGDADASKLQPGERNVARESSYTLKDYDSYWADTSKPEPIPECEPPTEAGQPAVDTKILPAGPPEEAKAEIKATSPREAGLRRKFSWEADETEQNRSPAPAPAAEAVRLPATTTADAAGDALEAEASKMQEPASSAAVAAQHATEAEPPSPVSTSDEHARLDNRLSLADEKAVSQLAPTPPPEDHPATAGPPTADVTASPAPTQPQQQQTQVMTFREIMGLSSSTDRIDKYNETREYFAANDSGLDNWLVTIKDQHPEYANGAVPYGAAVAGRQSAPGSSNESPVGTQPPSQQPYYQQYLNASSPTAGPSPTSRSRLGGLQMPSQGSGSAFGHSGNQIGTKSKEFMHSAGKMGKGLLSKGKSKLRASGDKDEASHAPVQEPKSKSEKRMSWGLALGSSRPRHDGPAPPADVGTDTSSNMDNAPTVAPQIPQPTLMSPLNSLSPPGQTGSWGIIEPPPAMGHGQQPPPSSPHPAGPGSRATAGLSKLEIPPGGQPVAGDSARGWQVVNAQPMAAKPAQSDQRATEARASEEWVVVPRDSGDHPIGFAGVREANVPPQPAPPVTQDSGVVLQPEPSAKGAAPQRKTSFVGLPPIRRTSTFGLTTKVKGATDRFSLDDDEDNVPGGAVVERAAASRPSVDLDKSLPPAPVDQGAALVESAAHPSASASIPQAEVAEGTGTQRTQGTDTQRTLVDANASGQPPAKEDAQFQEYPAPSSAARQAPQQTMAPPPKSPLMTKAQKMFPQGNWSLEESHLAEPLHERTRNRSGTAGSQHTPTFGFEKEMGITMPPPPTPPQRQRTSDVPPSSAQRWPELFQRRPEYEGQRPRANSGAGRPYPQQHPMMNARADVVNPRQQASEFAIAGVGPPEEERGRSKRSSGMFKGIGERISRATSRERRPSAAGQHPMQLGDVRGDEVSENSVALSDAAESRKRRPSFMFGRSGRASMDQSSLRTESINGPDQARPRGPDSPPPPAERRRSLFGAGIGSKLVPGQSPNSSVANDSSSAIATTVEDGTPKKKRFSNLAKVSGIKDIFLRPGHSEKSKDQIQETPGPGVQLQGPGAVMPPAAPFHERARRGSAANSHDLPPPQPVVAEGGLEERGRRGSASNLFSAFTGRRSDSKTRQQGDVSLGHNQPVVSQQSVQHPHGMAVYPRPTGNVSPAPSGMLAPATPPSPQVSRTSTDRSRPAQPTAQLQYGQQTRPSPLGPGSPAARGGSPSAVRPHDLAKTDKPVSLHSRKPSTPQMSQREMVLSETDRQGPFLGIGAQHDADVEILRTATVSPDLSIASDGKAEQQPVHTGSNAGNMGTPRQSTATPGGYVNAPLGVRAPRGDAPNGLPRERAGADHTPLGIINAQGSPGSDLGRHARNTSKEATAGGGSQLKQASPVPVLDPQPGSSPALQPQSARAQERAPVGLGLRQHLQPMHPQRMPPPQMQQKGAAAPGEPQQLPMQPHLVSAGTRLPSPPSQQDQGSQATSRWKGLKSRVSGQMAQIAPQNQAKQEKGEKSDRLSGSKLMGAFKRGPRQSEPTGRPDPQWQPNKQAQPVQRPAQPYPMANGPSAGQPPLGQAMGPPPQQVPHQRHVSMPVQGPIRQLGRQPAQQHAAVLQQEPVYDQVPIPQGYSTVRGEGMVASSPYNIPRHMSQGHYQQQQRQISLEQGSPRQSPPVGQTGFPRRGSAQSPPMGSSPSPPSTIDRRESVGINDVLAHQPSTNSLAAGGSRPGDTETGVHQGHLQPKVSGQFVAGHSSDGSHMSVDGATVSQQSKSPDLSLTDQTGPRNSNLGIDVDKAKKLAEENIYDATPRLNKTSTAGSQKQRPAQMLRTVSGETIDSLGEVKQHAIVIHDAGGEETPTAELDDTADRYERSRRLESQEEKILYKPEDAEDFAPQMSATSYPGQEWNPYGEPGFGEWKDE
ncbi:hypothetical protein JDV02_008183 [Purpureocillium takamizusanense]|uniref:Uncharacterized protein n=1 Tax=Purpureocillium takamizusanense TaxID=2060973 RepID=A0A9Q8VEG4_9HYPO|nr:uncharacterized protein JDV02_008183 [Purpureocillium takamizusanense]UNI22281.1 hypothetical protein JDV02_008183 [Purpureocillium takamizusanense]